MVSSLQCVSCTFALCTLFPNKSSSALRRRVSCSLHPHSFYQKKCPPSVGKGSPIVFLSAVPPIWPRQYSSEGGPGSPSDHCVNGGLCDIIQGTRSVQVLARTLRTFPHAHSATTPPVFPPRLSSLSNASSCFF